MTVHLTSFGLRPTLARRGIASKKRPDVIEEHAGAKRAGTGSNIASGVALASGGAALVTSETVVGGIGFGAIAGGAEATSLVLSGVQAGAQYYDKNYRGMAATIAGGALTLALGPIGNRFASAGQVAEDAPALKWIFNIHAAPVTQAVSNSCP